MPYTTPEKITIIVLIVIVSICLIALFEAGYSAMDAQITENQRQYAEIMKGR